MANDTKKGMTTSGGLYGEEDAPAPRDIGERIEAAISQGRRPRVGSQEQPVDPSVTPERLVPRKAPILGGRQQGKSEAMRQAVEADHSERRIKMTDAPRQPGMPGEVDALKLRAQRPYPPLESYHGRPATVLGLDEERKVHDVLGIKSYPGEGRFPRPTKEERKNMSMRTILDGLSGKVRDPDATYHDHTTGEVRRMDEGRSGPGQVGGIEHDPYDQLVQQAENGCADDGSDEAAEGLEVRAIDPGPWVHPAQRGADEGVEVAPGMTYEESVKAFGIITAAAQHPEGTGKGQGERVAFRRPVTASEMAAKQREHTRKVNRQIDDELTYGMREALAAAGPGPIIRTPEVHGRIVSMVEAQNGRIYVATERGVYRLEGDRLVPLQFDSLPDAP